MIETLAIYTHAMSLIFWFGGLFGYVMIVWPTLIRANSPNLPRGLLVSIGTRTAPWIYLAMASAFISLIIFLIVTNHNFPRWAWVTYLITLIILIGNNVYGSYRTWPAIMMSPDSIAYSTWRIFYFRMCVSLVIGLSMLSLVVLVA